MTNLSDLQQSSITLLLIIGQCTVSSARRVSATNENEFPHVTIILIHKSINQSLFESGKSPYTNRHTHTHAQNTTTIYSKRRNKETVKILRQ